MSERNQHRLSDDMSAEFDGETLTLYDTRAYRPKRITVITTDEMDELTALYEDGRCPVCLEEMPNDVICDGCFELAKRMRQ